MNRDFVMLQYRQMQAPMIVSFVGFAMLMVLGAKGLAYAAIGGWICFLWAADNLMGKSLVGDNAVMMHLLPASARTQVVSKVLVLGTWAGVMCSIPSFLMLRNGGTYIDAEVLGIEGNYGPGWSLFYRGLPKYRYAIDTCPSALDTAVGDLMDSGAGVVQIVVMAILIPIILFAVGCFFAGVVLLTQLYLHPLLRKLPTLVVTFLGMAFATLAAGGIAVLVYTLITAGYVSFFAGELLLFIFFLATVWFLSRTASQKLEEKYDVAA